MNIAFPVCLRHLFDQHCFQQISEKKEISERLRNLYTLCQWTKSFAEYLNLIKENFLVDI